MRQVVRVSTVVVLILVVVGGIAASAAGLLSGDQSGSFGVGATFGRLRDFLDLTSEQQQELLKTRQEHMAQTLELQFQLQRKILELREFWNADELDEEAIAQRAGEIAVLRVRLRREREAEADHERRLLTSEQLEKRDELTAVRSRIATGFRAPIRSVLSERVPGDGLRGRQGIDRNSRTGICRRGHFRAR